MSTNQPPVGPAGAGDSPANDGSNTITPLPGEVGIPSVVQPTGVTVSRKGIVAVALLAVSLVAVSAVSSATATARPLRPVTRASST